MHNPGKRAVGSSGRSGKKDNVSGSNAASGRVTGTGRLALTGRSVPAGLDQRTLTTKVTSKGQITVPKLVREHLHLAKGDRIEFLIGVDGKVTIMAVTADVRRLKGMVPQPSKPVSVEEMNQAIEAEGGKL